MIFWKPSMAHCIRSEIGVETKSIVRAISGLCRIHTIKKQRSKRTKR
jgi:hypothetical protein